MSTVCPEALPPCTCLVDGWTYSGWGRCETSGHYYFVESAFTSVTGKPCKVSSLRAKRRLDEESKEWKVRVWDKAGANIAEAGVVLVGDTVATGTTLAGAVCYSAAGPQCSCPL